MKKFPETEHYNQRIAQAARQPVPQVLDALGSTLCGLSDSDVNAHRAQYGVNKVTHHKQKSLPQRIAAAFINPFTAILFFLALVSTVTDMIFPYFSLFGSVPEDFDCLTVVIILTMVGCSGVLRFVQESRSGNAAARLLSMITTTCTVDRRGRPRAEIALDEVVVGDIVHLSAGDMIPADLRILEAKDLFLSQSSLTGESEPVEKTAQTVADTPDVITDYANIAFLGSNVISGSATGVVLAVGDRTLFGSMASAVAQEAVETSFTKGVNSVSWVLIRFMLVMVPLVFFINGLTKGDWLGAFLFGISIAVGLTPEMLPMIVTTCLAKGAVSMSRQKTIVKNLNSIQNFGAIDILCTDKTGTLTQDQVVLEYHMDVSGRDDLRVLRHAYLNSYFQTGYKNLMDLAIIRKTEESEAEDPRLTDLSEHYVKVDEIPFDFARRRLTTVVADRTGKTQMVTKGAVEEMLSICAKAADIGISVDTAVDVAKESADIILLEKDLGVLEQGIIEGRKTYANMIKYIKMTASSNFGNMFSVLAASALLPFLPMMSLHLIFLNLIYDLSCTAIPWDHVDEEYLRVPRKWDASSVGSFMIWLGPTSSIFDFTTYIFLYFVFCPLFVSHGVLYNDLAAHFSGAELARMQATYAALFQAGWFVESMWSQTLVIHMIRTPKIPFLQSRASAPLTFMTCTGILALTLIPFTPLGTVLGFVPLPLSYFAYLIPCILLYMVLATSLKKAYVRHYGELL